MEITRSKINDLINFETTGGANEKTSLPLGSLSGRVPLAYINAPGNTFGSMQEGEGLLIIPETGSKLSSSGV